MAYPFECPHCKHENKYTGDCLGEDETTEVECHNCEKVIEVTCSLTVTYAAKCLEADHIFEPVKNMPGYVECKLCERFKKAT